jgi:hypothetical protein
VASGGRRVLRAVGVGLAAFIALFLVGRGIAEFFVVKFSDPASYRGDWGGPSLAGVFAVHSGPALVIVASMAVAIWRRLAARRRPRSRSALPTGT